MDAEARRSFEGRIDNPESIEANAVECYDKGDAKRTVFRGGVVNLG